MLLNKYDDPYYISVIKIFFIRLVSFLQRGCV